MIKALTKFVAGVAAVTVILTGAAMAEGKHEAPMRELAKNQVMKWLSDPAVIEAIKQQNTKNASVGQGDIDKMDKQWRAEVKGSGGPLVNQVLANSLSAFLKKVKADSRGLFTEIFVMDNKGLNVGQSDVTSDFWQGDEAKWKKTFLVGPHQIHIGKVSMDESTQTLQSQLSMSIADPTSNSVIGAITIGVNVDMLTQ